MTPSQLSAIRENVSFDAVSIHDVIPLLAEVDRLTAALEAEQRRSSGFQIAYHSNTRCQCPDEDVCTLTRQRMDLAAERDAAFARGAEAMREAAVSVARARADLPTSSDTDKAWCRSAQCILEAIESLPMPEDR